MASSTLSSNQLLKALAREKHHLFINVLQAAEEVALHYTIVCNYEALGNTIKVYELNYLLKAVDNFLIIMTDIEFNKVFSRVDVLLVDF